ncbi:MAG TPA: hypothetical protein VFJ90_12465, partial [Candidatus Didemnitutus sp.]|nr:hypothetical protein [Candidatus Didemnitutus sp.]
MSSRLHQDADGIAPPRDAGRARGIKWALLGLAVIAAVVVVILTEFGWQSVPDLLEGINRPLALLAMALLPIVGFPISAVYLAAGALFGPWIGGAVVAGATLVHVTVTHLLAHTVLRRYLERGQKKWRERLPGIPSTESAALVAMIVIMPGLPYLARNGLLVFSGVPFRYLLGV